MSKAIIMCRGGGGADLDVITATSPDVLAGKVIVDKDGNPLTGTMLERGAVSAALNAGGSYTIPDGHHNGYGKVTANSLASQTPGSASAAYILSGQTAWVNGNKLTGTMANRGQAQYGDFGAGSDYYAINALPEGAYLKNGASWAPEARVAKTTVRSALGVEAWKIKQGEVIADVTGTMPDYSYLAQGQVAF